MDTVPFQNPAAGVAHFGWQFRPVLGRRAVAPGKRHLLVVLALPAPDDPQSAEPEPKLAIGVQTSWKHYDPKMQTTHAARWLSHRLPDGEGPIAYSVGVPTTAAVQNSLTPEITKVHWVPTDAGNGVAIVSGRNFFPGTTVRFGNKTYSGSGDGLIIKSDQELEVAVPTALAAFGGVLSGRYGEAKALVANSGVGFDITQLSASPTGDSLYFVDATLKARPDAMGAATPFASTLEALGEPYITLNGAQIVSPNFILKPGSDELHVQFSAPASAFASGAVVGATYLFGGITGPRTMTYYDTTLKVTRLSGEKISRLVIMATNPAALLCGGWKLFLESPGSYDASNGLSCLDNKEKVLALDIKTEDLKKYSRFILTNAGHSPLTGEIPKSDSPAPAPELDKDQKVAVQQNDLGAIVSFTGKHLDRIAKSMLDKTELQIVTKESSAISISLPKEVTEKVRSKVVLQLISSGNDPLLASFTVTPVPAAKGK
jgi:hypothetical protein